MGHGREIDKANSDHAHRLFQSVAVASRPLHAGELFAFDFSAGPIPRFRGVWRLDDPVAHWHIAFPPCHRRRFPGDTIFTLLVKGYLNSSRFAEKRDIISLPIPRFFDKRA